MPMQCIRGGLVCEKSKPSCSRKVTLRASLALVPAAFWGGFSGAPDKQLLYKLAGPASQRWLRQRLAGDAGGARGSGHSRVTTRGPHRLLVQPLLWPRAVQMGTEWTGSAAEVYSPHLPQGGFPILRKIKGSSEFLVSSWRILAQPSFALTLLFDLQ